MCTISIIYLLLLALNSKLTSHSAIQWVMQRGSLIENLKEAVMGNYQSIVSLTALLESGVYSKRLLDTIIDKCKSIPCLYALAHTFSLFP